MNDRPLVSVVIATKNRSKYLRQSIDSVLAQTFDDFELILVDDGSTDDTKEIIEAYSDPRVIYTSTPAGKSGISAARNHGANLSRGVWTAVHDDDDLMLPWRLEKQLEFAHEDDDFVFGTFINFDDDNGALQFHHGRNFNYGAALKTGFAPGHSTWLIKTELIKFFGYDEGLESAVDNNLAFRLLRSGIEARHSGVICLLRRVHSGRITDTGGGNQKYAATLNLEFLKSGVNSRSQKKLWAAARYDWGPTDKKNWETRFLPYLPDHLVSRSGWAFEESSNKGSSSRRHHFEAIPLAGAGWRDIYKYANRGAYLTEAEARYSESPKFEAYLKRSSGRKISSSVISRFIFHALTPGRPGDLLLIAEGADIYERFGQGNIESHRFDIQGDGWSLSYSTVLTKDFGLIDEVIRYAESKDIAPTFKLIQLV
ncbi:glycosyltransferase family 2 protein [Corynebacterium sp. YSMAA1_1_D6]|uniref:glycosyltransferase family 2 protein n=1 Tax=Corynebacterium sp. YSMAA1_1_D6 TaxID=3383589 RepID=UPI0038D05EAF